MNTISRFFLLISIVVLSACEGDEGPMGPPGEDGINITGTASEVTGTFNAANDYLLYYQFSGNLVDGDVVMVYILWGQSDGLDIWRALPQTIVLDQGILQYNFDYTVADIQIFLDTDFDPSSLSTGDTDNQTFRIVVIPADLVAQNKSLDIKDYNAVMKAMNISASSIQKVQLNSTLKVK